MESVTYYIPGAYMHIMIKKIYDMFTELVSLSKLWVRGCCRVLVYV